jgi:preprotein translocase subunit YajC
MSDPNQLMSLAFPLVLIAVLYFFMFRPQQKRFKEHQTMVANLKRGDQVVLSNGMIGKIVRVEDKEAGVEVAQGVTVKVVKSMIADVRNRTAVTPANDSKA